LFFTYKAQSIAKIIVISFAGIFTADITKSIVTRPADGIDAAPTEATVAVKLYIYNNINYCFLFSSFLSYLTIINWPIPNCLPISWARKTGATASYKAVPSKT